MIYVEFFKNNHNEEEALVEVPVSSVAAVIEVYGDKVKRMYDAGMKLIYGGPVVQYRWSESAGRRVYA